MMKKLLAYLAAFLLFAAPVLAQQQGGAGGGSSGSTTLTGDVTGTGTGTVPTTVTSFDGGLSIGQAWFHQYQSGNWYAPPFTNNVAASSAATLNREQCSPFPIIQSITVIALAINIGTVGTGNIQLAIYATGSNGYPTGSPLMATGNIVDTSTGNTSAASGAVTATTLTPGVYWGCLNSSDSAVKWMSVGQSSAMVSWMVGGTQAQMFNAVNQLAEGLYFPSTFGTWANLTGVSPTFASGTNYGPVIQMEEQ